MQFGAAERLVARDFAGRGLQQRRPGEEDLGAAAHHHDIIGEPGLIGAACGRGAVHDRNHGNSGRRQARHVGEGRAAAHEHLGLQEQVGACALDQLHVGQFAPQRDFLRADRLFHAHRMRRAALDAGIVRRDHAARARNHADADDRAAAVDVLLTVVLVHAEAAERRELEERRVAIEQEVDALARRQLAALAEFGVGPAGSLANLRFQRSEFGDQFEMRGAIGAERVAVDDDVRAYRRHADASLRPLKRAAVILSERAGAVEAFFPSLRAQRSNPGPHHAAPCVCSRNAGIQDSSTHDRMSSCLRHVPPGAALRRRVAIPLRYAAFAGMRNAREGNRRAGRES